MKVKYPVAVIAAEDKTKYLYRTQELLRLEHNLKGKEYNDGIITLSQWKTYLLAFELANNLLCNEILEQRNLFKKDVSANNNLSTSFEV